MNGLFKRVVFKDSNSPGLGYGAKISILKTIPKGIFFFFNFPDWELMCPDTIDYFPNKARVPATLPSRPQIRGLVFSLCQAYLQLEENWYQFFGYQMVPPVTHKCLRSSDFVCHA